MNSKTSIQILTLFFIGTLVVAIYLSYKNVETKKKLERVNLTLNQNKDSLRNQNERLRESRIEIVALTDSLTKTLSTDSTLSKDTKSLIEKIDNSKYLLTIYSLNPDPEVKKTIISTLQNEGYGVLDGQNFDTGRSWLSTSSTVLYYSPSTKSRAENIAKSIEEKTNLRFKVSRGAGLGVRQGEDALTFFVHYINDEAQTRNFVVVGSYNDLDSAIKFKIGLEKKKVSYPLKIFQNEQGVYAVCLGGGLSYADATSRIEYARNNIASDAYVKTATGWNEVDE